MISIENIPQAGIILVTVHFKGYKDSYANDARRKMRDAIPKIDQEKGLETNLNPLMFSLVRTIADGVTRATGAQWQFSYTNMTSEKFKVLYKEIMSIKNRLGWWKEIEIMIATEVWGVE